jgi:hypothetical protein
MAFKFSETFIPISQASELFPGRPHISSIWRWIRRGIRGRRLEAVRCGGRTFISKEAIARFLVATSTAAPPHGQTVESISEDLNAADRQLHREGFFGESGLSK